MDGRIRAYQAADTLGNSQIDLILKVYDGAIVAFRKASEKYTNKNYSEGYEQLEKAKKFLTHLYTTLDIEKGGDIAANLGKLYAFIINQTNVAESTKDITLLQANIEFLENLRSSWAELKDKSEAADKLQATEENETLKPGLVVSG